MEALTQQQPTPAPTDSIILDNLAIPRAPEPQPTSVGTSVPNIHDIVSTISQQLSLLATVISQQGGGMGNSQAEDQSLQDTVGLVLQQADWVSDKLAECIDDDVVSDAVKDRVDTEVEYYFCNSFDPSDHFDFHDAVSDAVDDRLDDVVRDRLDDVVAEQLEELVAEKLRGMKIIFE